MKQKTPMPKSSGKDAKVGASPKLSGMGKTSKPSSMKLPPVKTSVKHPRGGK